MQGAIGFDMVYPDSATGEYGSKEDSAPGICLADPTYDLECIIDPAEIVISKPRIRVSFRQRLDVEQVFSMTAPRGMVGFSRAALAANIAKIYQYLFQDEDKEIEDGLADLVLEGVWFDATKDVYKLRVSS